MWSLSTGRLVILMCASGVLGAEVVLIVTAIFEGQERAGSLVGSSMVVVAMLMCVVLMLRGARSAGPDAEEVDR